MLEDKWSMVVSHQMWIKMIQLSFDAVDVTVHVLLFDIDMITSHFPVLGYFKGLHACQSVVSIQKLCFPFRSKLQ